MDNLVGCNFEFLFIVHDGSFVFLFINLSFGVTFIMMISGARFGFTLDEELKKAAAAEDVRDALAAKISKERIGTEVFLSFLCIFLIGWSCMQIVGCNLYRSILYFPLYGIFNVLFFFFTLQVDLMISGNEPVEALKYIYELQLFSVVFSLPPDYEPALPEDCSRYIVGSSFSDL